MSELELLFRRQSWSVADFAQVLQHQIVGLARDSDPMGIQSRKAHNNPFSITTRNQPVLLDGSLGLVGGACQW